MAKFRVERRDGRERFIFDDEGNGYTYEPGGHMPILRHIFHHAAELGRTDEECLQAYRDAGIEISGSDLLRFALLEAEQ